MTSDPELNMDAFGGVPVPHAEPEPARVRDGHHAPRVEGGTLPDVGVTVLAICEKARALWRTARHPYADAMWPHLRPELIQVKAHLGRMLREDPDRDDVAMLLEEVRVWLGGRVV